MNQNKCAMKVHTITECAMKVHTICMNLTKCAMKVHTIMKCAMKVHTICMNLTKCAMKVYTITKCGHEGSYDLYEPLPSVQFRRGVEIGLKHGCLCNLRFHKTDGYDRLQDRLP